MEIVHMRFVIRHAFDQFVNLRPIKLFPGVATPLAKVMPEDIDFVIPEEIVHAFAILSNMIYTYGIYHPGGSL
jgi:isocitrate/isopropylmalate dehydrogenase